MTYIDHPPHSTSQGWYHLFADSIPELHSFASQFGIKRCWFENKRSKFQPHYDVREKHLNRLIAAGAVFVNWRDTPAMLTSRYRPWKK